MTLFCLCPLPPVGGQNFIILVLSKVKIKLSFHMFLLASQMAKWIGLMTHGASGDSSQAVASMLVYQYVTFTKVFLAGHSVSIGDCTGIVATSGSRLLNLPVEEKNAVEAVYHGVTLILARKRKFEFITEVLLRIELHRNRVGTPVARSR